MDPLGALGLDRGANVRGGYVWAVELDPLESGMGRWGTSGANSDAAEEKAVGSCAMTMKIALEAAGAEATKAGGEGGPPGEESKLELSSYGEEKMCVVTQALFFSFFDDDGGGGGGERETTKGARTGSSVGTRAHAPMLHRSERVWLASARFGGRGRAQALGGALARERERVAAPRVVSSARWQEKDEPAGGVEERPPAAVLACRSTISAAGGLCEAGTA